MKPSDYFKSMDEVEEYLETLAPMVTSEQYNILKIVLGFGEQEGEYVEIKSIGKIDKAIAELIQVFNKQGFTTLACCSGIMKEHPTWKQRQSAYVSFLDDGVIEKKLWIRKLTQDLDMGFEEGETYLKPSYSLQFNDINDEAIFEKWANIKRVIDKGDRR